MWLHSPSRFIPPLLSPVPKRRRKTKKHTKFNLYCPYTHWSMVKLPGTGPYKRVLFCEGHLTYSFCHWVFMGSFWRKTKTKQNRYVYHFKDKSSWINLELKTFLSRKREKCKSLYLLSMRSIVVTKPGEESIFSKFTWIHTGNIIVLRCRKWPVKCGDIC